MRRRLLILTLILLGSIATVFSLAYPVSMYVTSTYRFTSVGTAVNPEVLLDHSTVTVNCTGSGSVCYQQIVPCTYTETWTARTTEAGVILSTSITHVAFATSGIVGNLVLAFFLILLFVGLAIFAKCGFA
jgi:hypothetical protein